MELFFNLILVIVLSFLVGIERVSMDPKLGIKPFMGIAIGGFITAWTASLFHSNTVFGLILFQFLIVVGIWGAAILMKLHPFDVEERILSVMVMWIMACVGLLIGMNNVALGGFFATMLIILLWGYEQIYPIFCPYIKQRFQLEIELHKIQSLELIEYLMKRFRFQIRRKQMTKTNHIHLEIDYFTFPMSHQLFIKKIKSEKGVGEIIRITS